MTGVSVGGRSGRSTRIQVDGVDITDETVGTTVMNLTNESVQEFGIQQSSLDVSTDLTSSGAVNILTKSGTNSFPRFGIRILPPLRICREQRSDHLYNSQSTGGRSLRFSGHSQTAFQPRQLRRTPRWTLHQEQVVLGSGVRESYSRWEPTRLK